MNEQPLEVVARFMNSERKFTDDDVLLDAAIDGQLQNAAEAWVKGYDGDFAYLKDMRRDVTTHGTLSTGKARGVLNCMRNEILRGRNTPQHPATPATPATPAPKTDNENILPGLNRYAVTMDGKMRFLSVKRPEEGRWVGYMFVQELFGAPGAFRKHDVRGKAKEEVLAAIDPDALARFGRELGACGVCGSPLTDAASREAGIGPVCMAKL